MAYIYLDKSHCLLLLGLVVRNLHVCIHPLNVDCCYCRKHWWNHSLNSSALKSGDEGPQHTLEEFSGADLPLLVTETLTLDGREADVRFNPDGWAWLVCASKLLIWRSLDGRLGKACYELVLPQSEENPSADCVSLSTSQQGVVSCVACSAEGSVRYWPNVAQKGSVGETELNAEDYCVLVISLDASIVSRALAMPQSMLSGIGRRMSSFIFGASQPQPVLTKLHRVLPGEFDEESGAQTFYVLAGSSLQKWTVYSDTEKMVYEVNVEQWLRERLAGDVWAEDASRLTKLQTWLIDLHVSQDGVVVLGAGVNPDVSQQLYYTLGTISTDGASPPRSFLAFSVPKYTSVYQESEQEALLSFRLLCPQPSSAFLHSRHQVLCLSVNGSSQPVDKVEFSTPGDSILGFGVIDKQVIFLSDKFGLVTVGITG
ncbi:hypothetical protein CAPTEDRAFT_190764 [Capitella teleta]|uniref:Nucleoporin Nup133/Nup155-like N-terminal domain-containing protein n=1 Tax=Capitella teleta TaxID=283909 RepID=R7UWN4_CAPTE|nr:hypothetical protein CAPTEDRAFT_190764 [Capitella teleta]|eukprot:ELU11028.1 hypothetical protein CAPTEDRAFT_190764 [Capitella teleta]